MNPGLLLLGFSLLEGAVAGLCLFWPGRIDLRRVFVALIASSVVFGLACPAIAWSHNSFFVALHAIYLGAVVVLPFLALCVLLARGFGRAVSDRVTWIARSSLLVVPVALYATFVEPFRLTIERVDVPVAASRLGADLRVAVLADIQSAEVHDHLVEAVDEVLAFEPHLILLPGDLLQVRYATTLIEAVPAFRALLSRLEAPLGVWFVLGNCEVESLIRPVLEGTGVELLVNQTVQLEHAGRSLLLGGAGFYHRDPEVVAFVQAFEARSDPGLRLLFSHYPDMLWHLSPDSRVDLLVAGHTHGGQVSIPGFGPPITLSSVPRHVAAGGLHSVDGRRIYVSRGLGYEGGWAPRMRLFAPPELSLLTLRPNSVIRARDDASVREAREPGVSALRG